MGVAQQMIRSLKIVQRKVAIWQEQHSVPLGSHVRALMAIWKVQCDKAGVEIQQRVCRQDAAMRQMKIIYCRSTASIGKMVQAWSNAAMAAYHTRAKAK